MPTRQAFVAEFVGAFALVFVTVGAASAAEGDLLSIALAYGMTVAAFTSAAAHLSGGHFNPAITLASFLAGETPAARAAAYFVAQIAGGCAAAYLLLPILGPDVIAHGTPQPAESLPFIEALAVEAVLTFFLVFVYFGTVVDRRGPKLGGLAVGLAISLGVLFAGPLTGAALNPVRALGPALAANFWNDHAIYWAGPLLGGGLAGLLYRFVFLNRNEEA